MYPYWELKNYLVRVDDIITLAGGNGTNQMTKMGDALLPALSCLRYYDELAHRLKELQANTSLTDVTLLVDGKTFPAHRCVLAAVSPYFEALFTCGYQESRKKEIEIKEIDCNVFEMLLDCAYSGYLPELSMDTALDVFHGAMYLQFQQAQGFVIEYLANCIKGEKLSQEDAFAVMLVAEEHGLSDLLEICYLFLVKSENFARFIGSEEFIEKGPACLIYRFLGRGDKSPDETNEEQVSENHTPLVWLLIVFLI